MSTEYTVRSLMKVLTEMKKKGLADAPIKIESCDGCVSTSTKVEESKNSKGEKSVLIS